MHCDGRGDTVARYLTALFCVFVLAGCAGQPGRTTYLGPSTSGLAALENGQSPAAVPLPAPINISYRELSPVPYVEVIDFGEIQAQGRGTIAIDALADGRLKQSWNVTEFWVETGGQKVSVPIRISASRTLGADGSIWEIGRSEVSFPLTNPVAQLSDADWRTLTAALKSYAESPDQRAVQCLDLPRYAGLKLAMGDSVYPRNERELMERLADCAIALVRAGTGLNEWRWARNALLTGTNEEIRAVRDLIVYDLTKQAGDEFKFNSDALVRGLVVEGGYEYILVSGTAKAEGASGTGSVTFWALIDPYYGVPYRTRIDYAGPLTNIVPNQPQETGAYSASVQIDVPRRVPDILTIGVPRSPAIPGGTGSIAGVYRSSVGAIYEVVAGETQGSAFVIRPRELVTAAHVVEGHRNVEITSVDGRTVPGHVIRVDPATDLALIQVDADLSSRPLPLSQDVPVTGSQVLVIGSPARLEGTLTTGVVSSIRAVDGVILVQMDAAVNPGNSGGPALNLNGEVIGVVSWLVSRELGFEGLGFAIASPEIREFLRIDIESQ